jgi:hypothetical protein
MKRNRRPKSVPRVLASDVLEQGMLADLISYNITRVQIENGKR